jgi:phosphoribosyl 1,2-cyclic phosphodiesterase
MTVHLFLSHPHWDHIQGFPFFGPAYRANVTIYVYCPKGDDRNYRLLSGQMKDAYFPVRFSDLGAKVLPKAFEGKSITIDGVKVSQGEQHHPGGSLGFRFDADGQSVLYATDTELDALRQGPAKGPFNPPPEVLELARNVDLLIGDSQYFDYEYEKKVGWGHPRATTLVDYAVKANAKQLALFHHDPMHSDRDVDLKVAMCVEHAKKYASPLEIFGAREGIELKLGEDAAQPRRSKTMEAL